MGFAAATEQLGPVAMRVMTQAEDTRKSLRPALADSRRHRDTAGSVVVV